MYMRQMINRFLWLVLLATPLSPSFAFSLLGPAANGGDAWQIPSIGFNPTPSIAVPYGILDNDRVNSLMGPKNLGEEYRLNAPVLYYACDANFLDYFGLDGMTNVEAAFAILNNLTNVDSYSSDLSEFPLQSEGINYTAQSWGLYDLKSLTLALMMEQIGLADPIRYTWVIHDRYNTGDGAPCPDQYLYMVVSRNFDLLTSMPAGSAQYYSPYVNDTLYTFTVLEYCPPPPNPNLGSLTSAALPQNVDGSEEAFNSPVASGTGIAAVGTTLFTGINGAWGHLLQGGFYTGLTRDDVQGLRYLYSTNNVNFDTTAAGSVLFSSTGGGTGGLGLPFVLYTSNYTAFAENALTNPPSALTNLYPGLIILSTTYGPYTIQVPNLVAYFTNSGVVGNPPAPVIATNGFSSVVLTFYTNTYANLVVFTNGYSANTSARLVTYTIKPSLVLGNPPVTNTTYQTVTVSNLPTGDYYIATNGCGNDILYQLPYTNVVAMTNLILMYSNSEGFFYDQNLVIYSTNHAYWAAPFLCAGGGTVGVTNFTGLYQGLGKLQFVQANFDSLLGQYFNPVTNTYNMVYITNYQAVAQTFQRVVTAPDFVFSAQDLATASGNGYDVPEFARTIPPFSMDANYPGLAGPGVINPLGAANNSVSITFDKVGPASQNLAFSKGTNYGNWFLYGSFDGTTNTPVVYPDATSIAKLSAAVLIQVSPPSPGGLPNGTSNVVYTATFSATGGSPPYHWSLLPEGQLPDGLSLVNGVITGTPTRRGTYYFTIQMNDSNLSSTNTLNLDYSITIK
jgi:hypothetical protein